MKKANENSNKTIDLKAFEEIVKKVKENANKTTTEEYRTADQINDTRKVLPSMRPPSPLQFDTNIPSTKVPITVPGQIAVDIIAYEHVKGDLVPLEWSGAMNYDGG
ncbi:MAG: hypothetical protein WA941_10595 [Nitrososphaeraceae archaeon]